MTGASSFTGSWFCRALLEANAQMVVTLRRGALEAYQVDPLEAGRVGLWQDRVEAVYSCSFGDDRFLDVLGSGGFRVLCLHGAQVGAYQEKDFPIDEAVQANTRNLDRVLDLFRERGGQRVVLTHSYFAADLNHPTTPHASVSPYGESKAKTLELVRASCRRAGLELRVFWIPNPFGIWEKPGLTAYLFRCWKQGEVPVLKTPEVVRDFVPVDFLAKAYAAFTLGTLPPPHELREPGAEIEATEFVEEIGDPEVVGELFYRPGRFAESNLDFSRRLASQVEPFLGRACRVEASNPPEDFSEPDLLVQGDLLEGPWDEMGFWKEYVRWKMED